MYIGLNIIARKYALAYLNVFIDYMDKIKELI